MSDVDSPFVRNVIDVIYDQLLNKKTDSGGVDLNFFVS